MEKAPENRRILITGAQGFIGSRLLPFLNHKGHEVIASPADLLDFASLASTVRESRCDLVIHLAAISHVPTCEKDPAAAFKTNLAGTAVLLETLRRFAPQARLLFASTAQVYAAPEGEEIRSGVTMDESRKIAPQNLYARTKREAELSIENAARQDGLHATVLRLFNHTHHSQSPDFFLPHLYHEIQRSRTGSATGPALASSSRVQISVGNLKVSRDIGAITDLLEAFSAVVDRDRDRRQAAKAPFEVFNICSGTAKNLERLAEALARKLGVEAEFIVDPARVRGGEPEMIRGSHQRLTQATGWLPLHSTQEADLLTSFLAD